MRLSVKGTHYKFVSSIPTRYRIPKYLNLQRSRVCLGNRNFNQSKLIFDEEAFEYSLDISLSRGKINIRERLTRKKHDGFNDNLTIEYCLKAENISFRDISVVVQKATESQNYKPEEIIKRANRIIPEDIPKITILPSSLCIQYY